MKKEAFTIVQLFVTLAVVGYVASFAVNFLNQTTANGLSNSELATAKVDAAVSKMAQRSTSSTEFAGVLGKFARAKK